MKVLLAGAGGQVGRALLREAPADARISPFTREELDIADPQAVEAAMAAAKPDLVVNAAAYTAVDKAEAEPDAARRVNVRGAAALAQAAARHGARLVHFSTDFVFDGQASTPYAPNAPVAPLGVYGRTKAEGEQEVLRSGGKAIVIRTSWVYSAHGNNFMRTMIRLLRERGEVRVVADQVGTPTHARSLARACWKMTEADATGLHHFTDSGVASWYDFAVAIAEEAALRGLLARSARVLPIRTRDFPTPARRPSFSVLDKTETFACLGEPAAHWRTELRLALDEYAETENA